MDATIENTNSFHGDNNTLQLHFILLTIIGVHTCNAEFIDSKNWTENIIYNVNMFNNSESILSILILLFYSWPCHLFCLKINLRNSETRTN